MKNQTVILSIVLIGVMGDLFDFTTRHGSFVKFEITCPQHRTEPANIVALSSISNLVIKAECYGHKEEAFIETKKGTFTLNAYLFPKSANVCSFEKENGRYTYNLLVEVYVGGVLHVPSSKIMVCVMDPVTDGKSGMVTVVDRYDHLHHITHLFGKPIQSASVLHLVDLDRRIIHPEQLLLLGQKVKLLATMHYSLKYRGFVAWDCNVNTVYNKDGYQRTISRSILKAGCGDGTVFPNRRGFISSGRQSYSPVFEIFHFRQSQWVKFACNFSLCNEDCNGDSCLTHTNQKRSADVHYAELSFGNLPINVMKQSPLHVQSSSFTVNAKMNKASRNIVLVEADISKLN